MGKTVKSQPEPESEFNIRVTSQPIHRLLLLLLLLVFVVVAVVVVGVGFWPLMK